MKNQPIVVLGFGRSGTTWIADIISKSLGKLILFEPIHPSVTDIAEELAYSSISDNITNKLISLYNNIFNQNHRKMWLLRNHVPDRLENISGDFLELLWNKCEIGGIKEIRANFLIDWYLKNMDAKIVFIIRHPCATVSSIKGRPNFWEFGWPRTYEIFLQKTIFSQTYKNHPIQNNINLIKSVKSYEEKIAIMWAITHAISLPKMKELNLPVIIYENLYDDPFNVSRELLTYLGYPQAPIHPSYLFTPSMTTLKTIHGIKDLEERKKKKGWSFFWEERLTDNDVKAIMHIVNEFGIDIFNEYI